MDEDFDRHDRDRMTGYRRGRMSGYGRYGYDYGPWRAGWDYEPWRHGRAPGGGYGYGEEGFGRRPGTFAGRGPRGYQRSDERIMEDVCDLLTRHPDVDATDVTVDVENGEVTLSGDVDSRNQKRLAEDVIEDLPGVRDVHNRLRVIEGRRPVEDERRGQEARKRAGAAT